MSSASLKASPRRTLLQRGAALIAGALGVGAAARRVQGASSPDSAPPGKMTLQARRRPLSPQGGGEASGRLLSHGDILDSAGELQGAFYTNGFCMQTPFGSSLHAAANLEFQTLNVKDGVLFGIGAPGASGRDERHRAILGGTGRFAGARGSYIEREVANGVSGALEFVVNLSL